MQVSGAADEVLMSDNDEPMPGEENVEEEDDEVQIIENPGGEENDPSTMSTVDQFLKPFVSEPLQLTHLSEGEYSDSNKKRAKPALSTMSRREYLLRKQLLKDPKDLKKDPKKTEADQKAAQLQLVDFKAVRITANNTSRSMNELVCDRPLSSFC